MTAKELVMQIAIDRVKSLENEIKALEETLADKKEELERLSKYLKTEKRI